MTDFPTEKSALLMACKMKKLIGYSSVHLYSLLLRLIGMGVDTVGHYVMIYSEKTLFVK